MLTKMSEVCNCLCLRYRYRRNRRLKVISGLLVIRDSQRPSKEVNLLKKRHKLYFLDMLLFCKFDLKQGRCVFPTNLHKTLNLSFPNLFWPLIHCCVWSPLAAITAISPVTLQPTQIRTRHFIPSLMTGPLKLHQSDVNCMWRASCTDVLLTLRVGFKWVAPTPVLESLQGFFGRALQVTVVLKDEPSAMSGWLHSDF